MAIVDAGSEEQFLPGSRYQRRIERALRRRLADVKEAVPGHQEAVVTADDVTAEADFAEDEFEDEEKRTDPHERRRGSLPLAVCMASVFSLADVMPSYWAAEALGGSPFETWVVTGLFVAAVAGFGWMLSYYRHDGEERGFLVAFGCAASMVAAEVYLRFDYLRVVAQATLVRATFQAFVLGLITTLLIWLSYLVLVRARSVRLHRQLSEMNALKRQAVTARHGRAATGGTLRREVDSYRLIDGASQDGIALIRTEASKVIEAGELELGRPELEAARTESEEER